VLADDISRVWRGAAAECLRCRRGAWAWAAFLGAVTWWTVFLADDHLLELIAGSRRIGLYFAAGLLTDYLDFVPGILIPLAVVWWVSARFRRPEWRVLAVAALLSAALSGAAANGLRMPAGRARPNSGAPAGLHGLSFDDAYHSFCSAHAASTFSAATALALGCPAVGVPAAGLAAGVAWSRVYLRRHYPSDVLCGSMLGIGVGWVFGMGVRRSRGGTTGGGNVHP
jgi:undecaprenyl-diphosphatase